MGKRIFDLFGATVLLVVLSPILLLISFVVRTTSSGPIIFRQERMGFCETGFTIFKFRTMIDGSSKPFDAVVMNDPRVTKIGGFLRSTHLDELPQLWNIFRGDMSLVGPRPNSIDISKLYADKIPGYRDRFKVRPGLTGPVQIRGRKSALRKGVRGILFLELRYIQNQGFLLDLWILYNTLSVVFRKKGI